MSTPALPYDPLNNVDTLTRSLSTETLAHIGDTDCFIVDDPLDALKLEKRLMSNYEIKLEYDELENEKDIDTDEEIDDENDDFENENDNEILNLDNNEVVKSDTATKFTCLDCEKLFDKQQLLDRHVREIHTNLKNSKRISYKCVFCEKKFNLRTKIKAHMSVHVRLMEAPHNCQICNSPFPNPSSFKDHLLTHCKETPFSCYVCAKSFPEESALTKHKQTHRNERNYKCTKCNKWFKYIYSLETHTCHHRGGVPALKCDVCDEQFWEPARLAEHRARHFDEQYNYSTINHEVNECSKPPPTNGRKFRGRSRHQCKICDKYFTQSSSLKIHMKGHTGEKPIKCEYCDKGFHIMDHYTRHRRVHTKERPFVCQVCAKTFSQQNSLKQHYRVHTGEKPYVCDVCHRAFAARDHLNKHYRVHTGEKPFACKHCDKKYSQSTALKRHSVTHHDEFC